MNTNRRFIDLFAGCGGLSLGLTKAGWRGLFAVEKNADAFSTLRHNLCDRSDSSFDWPDWLPCQAMSTAELMSGFRERLLGLRGQVEMIAGGPPCQGFSFAGKRHFGDPRNQLKNEYLEIVDLVRPNYLIFENVRGFSAPFKNGNEKLHSEQVIETLEGFDWGGYHVFSDILNASDFGVPQPRARFILIAVRKDLCVSITSPFAEIKNFAAQFREKRSLNGHEISVSEAISDLEISVCGLVDSTDTSGFMEINYRPKYSTTPYQKLMRLCSGETNKLNSLRLAKHRPETVSRFIEVLKTCPKGVSLPKEFREKHKLKKQCFTPLHPDQMSKTITTLPDDLLHYSEPRILTVRETARLQSFPDSFEFKGKYTTGGARRKEECPRYTQVGNAVPPLMAEALGERILQIAQGLTR
jgi:DNA (cytosine-5)-methyltransferase 1